MEKIIIGLVIFALIIGVTCGVFYFLNEKNFDNMMDYIKNPHRKISVDREKKSAFSRSSCICVRAVL